MRPVTTPVALELASTEAFAATKLTSSLAELLRSDAGAAGIASVLWASCSIAMTLLNHAAVHWTGAPMLIVLIQTVASTVIALGSRTATFGQGTLLWSLTVPPLFVVMMASSLAAFSYVSVGAFVVVRNLGPLVALAIETTLHRGQPSSSRFTRKRAFGCSAIAVGVALYEMNDVSFSTVGLVLLLLNLGSAVLERVTQRHLLAVRPVAVSKSGLVVLNNGIGSLLAALYIAAYRRDECYALAAALHGEGGPAVLATLVMSCAVGALIAYAGLWLQSLVTATTFMVLGCFARSIVIGWGIVFHADTQHPLAIGGAALSLLGSLIYGIQRGPSWWPQRLRWLVETFPDAKHFAHIADDGGAEGGDGGAEGGDGDGALGGAAGGSARKAAPATPPGEGGASRRASAAPDAAGQPAAAGKPAAGAPDEVGRRPVPRQWYGIGLCILVTAGFFSAELRL